MKEVADTSRSRALWREQAILGALGALALAAAVGLTTAVAAVADREMARSRAGLRPRGQMPLVVASVAAALVLVVLVAAAVVHTVRVARFTFRRGAP